MQEGPSSEISEEEVPLLEPPPKPNFKETLEQIFAKFPTSIHLKKPLLETFYATLIALEGGIDGISALNTVGAIAEGTDLFQPTMQVTANFVVPPVAIIGAISFYLEQNRSEHLKPFQRLWKAFSHDLRLASFLLPLFFFIISSLLRAIKHIPDNEQVDISDTAAAAIITACFSLSTAEGIKTYYDEINKIFTHIQRAGFSHYCEKTFTHPALRRLLAALDGASAVHWLIAAIEGVAGISQGFYERIFRYTITGVAGLVTAVGHGSIKAENHLSYKILDWTLLGVKAVSFGLSSYTLFSGPKAKNFWDEKTLLVQIYFWLVFFPLFILFLKAGGFALTRCSLRQSSSGFLDDNVERIHPEREEEPPHRTPDDNIAGNAAPPLSLIFAIDPEDAKDPAHIPSEPTRVEIFTSSEINSIYKLEDTPCPTPQHSPASKSPPLLWLKQTKNNNKKTSTLSAPESKAQSEELSEQFKKLRLEYKSI